MEKYTYLALVERSSDGWYAISYPDLPGAHAQARTLDEVSAEAKGALESYLFAAEAIGQKVAAPSETLPVLPGQMVVIATADMDLYKRMQDAKPVKKTVSLPAWLADSADRAGLSLSKVLQDSLKTRLNMRES